MDEGTKIIAIVGSLCGVLLVIMLFLLIKVYIVCRNSRKRQNTESETGMQGVEYREGSVSTSSNDNITCFREGQIENDHNINNMVQEQVFQLQHENPPLQPSAPPLPPDYYIEYT